MDSDDRRIPGRVNTYTVVARLVAALVGTVVENALEFKASMTGTKEYFKDSAKDSKKRKRKIGEGKLDIAHVVFGAANNPSTRTRFLRLMTHRAPVIQTGFDIGNLDRHCPSLRESGIRRMIEHKRRLMRNKHRQFSKRKKAVSPRAILAIRAIVSYYLDFWSADIVGLVLANNCTTIKPCDVLTARKLMCVWMAPNYEIYRSAK